jgi:pimeloyl-ACP methyl ester carboxylesterase
LTTESRSGSLDIEGAHLEYRWFGPPAPVGADIVLLHEGLGSVAMWKAFPDRLAEATGRRVFAYSRQGYGASLPAVAQREPDYMHVEAEAVLPKVLDAAGVERPILFGHSDGASIALLYAAAHPDRVSALILEAPHVFVEPLTVDSITATGSAFRATDLRGKLARYHGDVDAAFQGWLNIWLDPRFRAWNIEAGLERVACPTLMIQGLDDEYGTRAQLDAISARIPGAKIVMLERCGHSPHRDQAEQVLEHSRAFSAGIAHEGP